MSATSFTIARGALLPALKAVNRAVEKRNTIPILGNVLMSAEDDRLCVTCTNLDLEVRASAEAPGIDAIASFTMPSALLHDAVSKFADGANVKFEGDDAHVNVSAGRSRFRLQVLPASDFPEMSAGDFTHHFSLTGADMADAIAKVSFAISTEETRYYLNGIYLHRTDDHLAFVATDGHRLALVKLAPPEGSEGMPGVIIPRATVSLLRHLASAEGDVAISLSAQKIRFEMPGGIVITSKLIDGNYPDYPRVIPANNDKSYMVEREALTAALGRVMTLSSERGRAVKFCFKAVELQLETNNPDHGQAQDSINITGSAPDDFQIGFNGRYCLDILEAVDSKELTFELSDPGSPCKITPTETPGSGEKPLFVLMPMRV
ncbi:DNA polymerase III subunit beta [Ochrobactrum chromiisoli]|uniref:Beta sliding clamp n=1 Tax=Ochrobactrum chromiisoli TaxID=2993941 RepID=A0ABT3QRZ4_9HYPH|nr:DNA polymerase III subunit beta [Ochrobactrum chromiisoli]MCX2698355.1 DNA polymerase III subunit beta [Ochrobactrum chromiisoli]